MQTMKKKQLLTVVLLALTSLSAYAQISVTSYSVYALGINTSKEKKISGELKGFFNAPIDELSFEASAMYNFKTQAYHRFSIGIGADFSPFTGGESELELNAISIPCQLEVFPLQDFKQLSFVMDFAPQSFDGAWSFRYLWGIRYTFGSK
jgi:hypothetical protein